MSNGYKQTPVSANSRFASALFGSPERSKLYADPTHLTTFNGGDIVPIYCREILPNQTLSLSVDSVIRQITALTPTMGNLTACICAFWVPNRIVNDSWTQVQGENLTGSWVSPEVSLVPLYRPSLPNLQIPIGSVADYYGFPTQGVITSALLSQCNDLKFRGYVKIYNEFFRDQNYQPPIPLSTLNVYQGFLEPDASSIPLNPEATGTGDNLNENFNISRAGSPGAGAVQQAIYGASGTSITGISTLKAADAINRFFATQPPLKANKLHDYFTTVLPAPQKGPTVFVPVSGRIPQLMVGTSATSHSVGNAPLHFANNYTDYRAILTSPDSTAIAGDGAGEPALKSGLRPDNLYTTAANIVDAEIPLTAIREAAALQQYYECLARGGSRYRELVQSIFGVSVEDPYDNVPKCLGKEYFSLDLYQTAQTSGSEEGSTPQGNLAAFGYTHNSRELFPTFRFLEHGYLHVFCIVRHRNIYSSYFSRDNFRLNALDFYTPFFANLSDQPIYTREINPFTSDIGSVFGYNEAWADYRYEPDAVSGYMRPGVPGSLAYWNYSDDYDPSLVIADAEWLRSNTSSVVRRTCAVQSETSPEFKAQFTFFVNKDLPMPTVSVPGLDII